MDGLRELCARPDSVLGQVARAQLDGLRQTLEALASVLPDDPGAADCASAIADLAALPAAKAQSRPGKAGRKRPAGPAAAGDAAAREAYTQLAELTETLASSAEARDYLGSPAPPGDGTVGQLWEWYHLMLLRLPIPRAVEWRNRAAKVEITRGDQPPETTGDLWEEWPLLPDMTDASILIPALSAGEEKVVGVRLSSAGAPDDWAVAAAGLGRPEPPSALAADGAVLGTWIARMARRDKLVYHVLEGLTVKGLRPLQDERERQAYVDELARRLARAADQSAAPADQLRTAVALDEALRSVIHLPPAADKSWWATISRTSEEQVLKVSAKLRGSGADVRVSVPAAMYADARRQTRNDVPLGIGGEVGQVLAVLKLWSQIDGKEQPGRVAHRLESGRTP
jgi:hypothetical protein